VVLAWCSLCTGLAIVAAIAAIVGMGRPITGCAIIVSTLGAPALTELGSSLLAAHLIIFSFSQTATITPPVCMTAFVAAQIAGAPPMRTGFEALWLAKALYLVPVMLAYSRLLSGNPPAMLFDAIAGSLWLTMFPLMTEGYYFGRLSVGRRGVVAAASIAFLMATFSLESAPTLLWLGSGIAVMVALAVLQSRESTRPSPISARVSG
jgi:TRAP-type uncharacterized transport system fused permease subunit